MAFMKWDSGEKYIETETVGRVFGGRAPKELFY